MKSLRTTLEGYGPNVSVTYSNKAEPNQNPIEAEVRAIRARAHALQEASPVAEFRRPYYFGYALKHAAFLRNYDWRESTHGIPHTMLTGCPCDGSLDVSIVKQNKLNPPKTIVRKQNIF